MRASATQYCRNRLPFSTATRYMLDIRGDVGAANTLSTFQSERQAPRGGGLSSKPGQNDLKARADVRPSATSESPRLLRFLIVHCQKKRSAFRATTAPVSILPIGGPMADGSMSLACVMPQGLFVKTRSLGFTFAQPSLRTPPPAPPRRPPSPAPFRSPRSV